MESIDDFDVAVATLASSGDSVAIQLLSQLRSTRRILDNFRFSVNGPKILDVELDFHQILPADNMRGYKLRYQYWPRDINIRRNLTTSSWADVLDLVATNNVTILDSEGAGVPTGEIRRVLDELPDEGPEAAAIRWAIVVGEDGLLKLQLQTLPSVAATLNGRPITKG